MTIIVYDVKDVRNNLLPITYTRPVGAIRIGISTMAERWQAYLSGDVCYDTVEYLSELFPKAESTDDNTRYVAGHVVATEALAAAVLSLRPGETLVRGELEIAHRGTPDGSQVEYAGAVLSLQHVYDIFTLNDKVLALDFDRITSGRRGEQVAESCIVIGDKSKVFIEAGAVCEAATLNTRQGPIYIGRDAEVMEGSHLRGPIAVCDHGTVNMGTKIYGATTIGPWCKVGGELNNVVMLGYANKAHDGFLGNAVIGEWCNLGGGTIASNLKNDYSEAKLWNYPAGRFLRTGLLHCGLIMGDHSKSAVNTKFNTATTVGVGCNIISEGMPRVFIPSFSKGGTAGFDNVHLGEFFTIAERMMARRGCVLTDAHRRMFEAIADYSDNFK